MRIAAVKRRDPGALTLADQAYQRIRAEIFEFELVPGDRFSEAELAQRLGMSRTPVREALSRLQREGYLEVHFKSGWSVRPFDFEQFEHLYDLRMVLETTAIRRLCEGAELLVHSERIEGLKKIWLSPKEARESNGAEVARLDEDFHMALVEAAGNPEIARVHRAVTERIRIIRRLDFTQTARIDVTYEEHAQILNVVLKRRGPQAELLLRSHIEQSKAEVRKITLHKLYTVRAESAERNRLRLADEP
jgi:DNA-binding GntR family transcriptional regulator